MVVVVVVEVVVVVVMPGQSIHNAGPLTTPCPPPLLLLLLLPTVQAYRLQGKEGIEWASQLRSLESTRGASSHPLLEANKLLVLEGTQCKTDKYGKETFYSPYQQPLRNNETRGYLR